MNLLTWKWEWELNKISMQNCDWIRAYYIAGAYHIKG